MTAFPTYSTGTVAVANGATAITGTGSNWTGANAKPGDDIVVDSHTVVVLDVTDATHLAIDAWPFTSVVAGASYKIIKRSPLRFVGGDAMADVSTLVAALNTDGFYVFVAPDLTEPDPSYGEEDQFALQPSTGKLWLKTGGAWVFQGVYKGFNITGAWSGATAYAVGDVVSLSGTSYICLLAHTNHTPPNATYWQVLAAKGDTGATGPAGPSDPTSYSTKAVVEGATISTPILFVRIAGYAAAGDGGGAMYKRVATEPAHDGKIQSSDGAWWEISETVLRPEMFGAVADSATDDSAAIQSAFDCTTSNRVTLNGGYALASVVNLTLGKIIDGKGILHPDTSAGCINVDTDEAVILRDFGIYYSALADAGTSAVMMTGPTQNSKSIVENLFISLAYVGVNTEYAALWTVQHNYFNACNTGIIVQNLADPDSGDSLIFNNTFADMDGSAIVQNSSGGLSIIKNKINVVGTHAIRIDISAVTITTGLTIALNSIEGVSATTGSIVFTRQSTTGSIADVKIHDNELTGQFGVYVDAGTTAWVTMLNCVGNNFLSVPTSGNSVAFNLSSVDCFVVAHNTIRSNGAATYSVITTSDTSNGIVGPNISVGANLQSPSLAGVNVTTPSMLSRGHIAGLTLSTAGSSATFGIAAGVATDSTNASMMALVSAYTKTTSAWAVGTAAGSLDSGSIATSTWYHLWLIKRPDTGVVDVLTSLSASSPALPTNYTLKRRIGSMKTNGSAQWTKFIQDGDTFQWDAPVADVNATNPGTSAVTRTLTTPLGVRVEAIFSVLFGATLASDNPAAVLISDLSVADTTPSIQLATLISYSANNNSGVMARCFTNTSSQVRSRLQISTAGTSLYVTTFGWVDRRGRDS